MMYYTGVGARRTPKNVLKQMFTYGKILAKLGFTLRSGAADGADAAFEQGCDAAHGSKEIYLPWRGYNNHRSSLYNIDETTFSMARDIYGPRWNSVRPSVHKLMARNIYQILGQNLDTPSLLVICWTPDGAINESGRSRLTGGTGQAIACASRHNIPVFNFKLDDTEDNLKDYIGNLI